jgi:rubrerythrin
MGSDTLQSVIDLAIQREEEALNFYLSLCSVVQDKTAKDTLKYLAEEEAGHKAFLVKCKEQMSCDVVLRPDFPVDYKVAEHLKQPDIKKDLNSEEVFLIAANRELNAHNFYKDLADLYPKGQVKELLSRMASEEMKHKEKMEYLYANTAFAQTSGG